MCLRAVRPFWLDHTCFFRVACVLEKTIPCKHKGVLLSNLNLRSACLLTCNTKEGLPLHRLTPWLCPLITFADPGAAGHTFALDQGSQMVDLRHSVLVFEPQVVE